MTTEEKLDRLTDNLNHLTGVVGTLAASIVAHDAQIENLIKIAEQHHAEIANLQKETQTLVREWQAYLRTIRSQ
jgi:hypothetical protein